MSETTTQVEPKIIEGTQTVIPEATPAIETKEINNTFKPKEGSTFPEEAQREIFELHRENASKRHKYRELEKELTGIKDSIKKEQEDKLSEQGKYK